MNMNREDVLRELELLPVWRLRVPLAGEVACATTPNAPVAQATSPAEDLKSPNALVAQPPPPANTVKKIDNPNLTQGIHQRGYLPHLKAEGGIYAVTFRLHDSLPANVLAQMADLAANEKNAALEAQLNAGHGECLLAQPQVAEMLKQILLAKHYQDYHLHAWVIMPNHVHLLVEPLNSCVLSDIMQAIKSISARQANQLLVREGAFWQRESYDHLVRDEDDFNHALEYIVQNPVKANLVKHSHEYALGSAFAGEGACATTPLNQAVSVEIEKADAPVAQAPSPANQVANNHILICSVDKNWAFILPTSPDLSTSQACTGIIESSGMLFSNILQALKIEKTNKTTLINLADIDAKVIIAMGEGAAQVLLNTQDSLEQLRGKPHLLHNIPLIVTYHPNDCLQHLPNKSKTWDDLCAALSIMNA